MANPVSIGTSATLIHTFSTTNQETLKIRVDPQSPLVYLGPNSSVSTSNGLAVGGGSALVLERGFGQSVYGIVAAGQGIITWLSTTS